VRIGNEAAAWVHVSPGSRLRVDAVAGAARIPWAPGWWRVTRSGGFPDPGPDEDRGVDRLRLLGLFPAAPAWWAGRRIVASRCWRIVGGRGRRSGQVLALRPAEDASPPVRRAAIAWEPAADLGRATRLILDLGAPAGLVVRARTRGGVVGRAVVPAERAAERLPVVIPLASRWAERVGGGEVTLEFTWPTRKKGAAGAIHLRRTTFLSGRAPKPSASATGDPEEEDDRSGHDPEPREVHDGR
ncbi:MAG: hypothetical protein ACC662_02960, partial [Planctomycetota bacterium]